MKKIAIIGSGSWGVALAIHLASIGNKVKIWSYEEEEKRLINEEKRCMFLPNVTIPENIECSNDFKEVIEDAEFILHVTPSKFTRSTFKQYKQYVGKTPIIICGKGFEKETLETLDEVILEESWDQKIKDVQEHDVDVFVMGDDWKGQFDFLKDYCEVVYLPRTEGISTTKIKDDLKDKL